MAKNVAKKANLVNNLGGETVHKSELLIWRLTWTLGWFGKSFNATQELSRLKEV